MVGSNGNQVARPKPRIGITIGDPAGIGPEVSLRAVAEEQVLAVCTPLIIGDAEYLLSWAEFLGVPLRFNIINVGEDVPAGLAGPTIYDLKNLPGPPPAVVMGREQAAAGKAAAEYIEAAVRLCQAGVLDAITTAPINKKSFFLGGVTFPGHTEFLAHLTGTEDFAMTFFSPTLRVALLTTHVPLSEVSSYVKQTELERLIRLVNRELIRFGFNRPRIAVAALNPHGGEGGLFGKEEAAEIIPAIEACRQGNRPTDQHPVVQPLATQQAENQQVANRQIDRQAANRQTADRQEAGIDVSGPHSGDTIFLRASRGEFDLVISCYHDQGLIPVKCFSFGEAVNLTMGLPFIRTSVDHGTAFDIAGQGKADHSSMATAIKLAAELFERRRDHDLQPASLTPSED